MIWFAFANNSGIGLIPEGMELVSDGLQQNTVLTSLDLSCNALGTILLPLSPCTSVDRRFTHTVELMPLPCPLLCLSV
jgi:hypothetical protein